MRSTMILAMVTVAQAFALGAESKPEVGPETVVMAKGQESQWDPAAAWNGKDAYLVVWSEGSGIWGGEADVFGARVKPDGSTLDAQPIVISKAKDFQKRPRVAWVEKENDWLVVWQDFRNGKDSDIYAARVSAEGKVLDPDGIAVCTEKGDQNSPAVASDGQGCLVVWGDYRSGDHYDVYGATVKGGAAPASSAAMVAGGGGRPNVAFPSVAWTGKDYLVVATHGGPFVQGARGGCWVVRAGPDGALKDAAPQLRGVGLMGHDTAAAAAPGAGRVVAMVRTQTGKRYDPNVAYAILMDADATPVACDNPGRGWVQNDFAIPTPAPICLVAAPYGSDDVWSPAVAASGEWFLCLHQSKATVRHALIRAKDGHVTDEGELNAAGSRGKTPNAAGGPAGEFLVLYERNNPADASQKVCARVVKVKP